MLARTASDRDRAVETALTGIFLATYLLPWSRRELGAKRISMVSAAARPRGTRVCPWARPSSRRSWRSCRSSTSRACARSTPETAGDDPLSAISPLIATTAIAAAAEPARRAVPATTSRRARRRGGWNEIDGVSTGLARSAMVKPLTPCSNARQSSHRARCASSSTSSNSESSESTDSESCWRARAQSAGKIERICIQPLDVQRVAVVSIGRSSAAAASRDP